MTNKVISKVTSLPTVLKPDMIYLVKQNGGVYMCVANNTGTAIEKVTVTNELRIFNSSGTQIY